MKNGMKNPRLTAAILLAIFAVGVAVLVMGIDVRASAPIRIGVLAHKGTETCRQMWQPTMTYLDRALPGRQFDLVPLKFEEIEPAVKNMSIDFLICNPAIYVDLEVRYGVTRTMTLRNLVGMQIVSEFGGVIFCRAERGDIQDLRDARGRRLAAVGQTSFGGWLMALREFRSAGINPERDCARLFFLDSHPAVVRAVLSSDADMGAVRTDTIERMAVSGEIRMDTIRVIPGNTAPGPQPPFPYMHSTRLYPEWPFAKLSDTTEDLSREVTVALLTMPADSPAAVAAESGGWGVCLDYTSVHDCLRELRLPPYEQYGQMSWPDVWHQYWPWMGAIASLILALLGSLLLLRGRNLSVMKISGQNRLLLTSVGEGICGIDLKGITTFINPAASKMLGYTDDEMLGRNLHVLTHHTKPDDRPYPEHECPIFMACNDGTVHHGSDEFFYRKDGSSIPVFYSSRPIVDEGRISGAVISFQDITEKNLKDEEQRKISDRLSLACRAGGIGIWELDVVHSNLIWDDQMFELYGITPDKFSGTYEAWRTGVHPEDLRKCEEELQVAIRGEKDFDTEFRVVWPDGTIHSIRALASVQRDAAGQAINLIGTNYDLTERKRTEESLRESEARLRVITGSAQDAILMMDTDGLISYWNPAAERILGYKSAEAIGQSLHAFIVPARYYEAHLAAFPAFQQTGQGAAVGKTLDLEARRKDGTEISIQLSLSTVHMSSGWHAVGILRDITERKHAEAELQRINIYLEEATARANDMAAQAEMASAAKSEFLANMSHEIRTPMNGVIGMTGLLLDTALDDEQRRYAEIVRASGELLLGLINDILDFSKIEAKKLGLEVLDFDLSSLLDDFVAALAVRAHEKRLELLCSADLDVPTLLRGDPGRLRQILTNLAGNAIKFTSAGEVAVRVSLVKDKGTGRGVQEAGGEETVLLRFSVRDTGIGIPKDKIGLLFEKFSQVDASTTRQYGGTGLGLAISKQLVELMGGEAGVSSEEGRGSEFWFTARLVKQTMEAHVDGIPPADLSGARVLIVDDNATNREILSTRLTSWGMRPFDAQGGPEALQALSLALDEKDPFRIAVIDMQMPGMDGETLGRAIHADDRLTGIRMVMLTSLGMRGDARHFQEIGFAAYATKPIRHQELKAVLSLALTDRDGAEPTQTPIVTRHTAREMLNLFTGRNARILLAEDNITNQQVALGILKKLGLRADAVANGAEALRALETLPYDLVLMDVQMPEMGGFEATRQIRNPQSPIVNHRIPVIAMTAHAMQGDRERCLEAGMNDYITKPVSPQALADALDKWLPKKHDESAMVNAECSMMKKEKPETDDTPSSLIFDRAGMMVRLMEDEELAQMVVESFLEDIPRQITLLKGFLETGDAAGAERQAHTIKGASANVGGERLREVAFAIEKAARAGDLSAALRYVPKLEAQLDALNQAITRKP